MLENESIMKNEETWGTETWSKFGHLFILYSETTLVVTLVV